MWDLFLLLLLKPISRYCIEICLISEFIQVISKHLADRECWQLD